MIFNKESQFKIQPMYILIVLLIVLFDQITKFLVRHYMDLNQSIPIIKNIFHLTYITNTGTFFGLFQGTAQANLFFVIFTIILLGGITYVFNKLDSFEKPFFALIIGAAIGNLIDRLVFGHVIDFLDLRFWPVFNVADTVLSISLVVLIIYTIKEGVINSKT
jgi:signal peptidase II